jgi:tetratricopeptide (TPR) repeat protein
MAMRRIFVLPLGALALIAAPQVFAAGGGGGGGGGMSMPSESAPSYDPAAEYTKGATAYQAKDYKAAATAFKRVVDVVPKHAPAQYLLGSSYLLGGDFKKARKPLEAAVKQDATLVDAQRDLGIVYAKLGEAAKATAQRERLAAMKTACGTACAGIDAAIAALDAALSGAAPQALGPTRPLRPSTETDQAYVEAVGLNNEGRYAAAIDRLDAAVWSAGPHPDLLTYLGFANRKLKRYDTAKAWYEEALAIAPAHRGALEYYGELKLELGDRAGARAHLARLDALCGFGCQQADELRAWIDRAAPSAS